MKETTILMLAFYVNAVAEIKKLKSVEDAKAYARDNNINIGACLAETYVLGTNNFYNSNIVQSYCTEGNYWAKTTGSAKTKRDVISRLQKRVTIMKRMLKIDLADSE